MYSVATLIDLDIIFLPHSDLIPRREIVHKSGWTSAPKTKRLLFNETIVTMTVIINENI